MVALLVAVLGLFVVTPAAATPITVVFVGHVPELALWPAILTGVSAGDPIRVELTYDDAAVDLRDTNALHGLYVSAGAPFGARLTFGALEIETDEVVIQIVDRDSDRLGFWTDVFVDGDYRETFYVLFDDDSGAAITGDALSQAETALGTFPRPAQLSFAESVGMYGRGYGLGYVWVPEPAGAWLVALGLAAALRRAPPRSRHRP